MSHHSRDVTPSSVMSRDVTTSSLVSRDVKTSSLMSSDVTTSSVMSRCRSFYVSRLRAAEKLKVMLACHDVTTDVHGEGGNAGVGGGERRGGGTGEFGTAGREQDGARGREKQIIVKGIINDLSSLVNSDLELLRQLLMLNERIQELKQEQVLYASLVRSSRLTPITGSCSTPGPDSNLTPGSQADLESSCNESDYGTLYSTGGLSSSETPGTPYTDLTASVELSKGPFMLSKYPTLSILSLINHATAGCDGPLASGDDFLTEPLANINGAFECSEALLEADRTTLDDDDVFHTSNMTDVRIVVADHTPSPPPPMSRIVPDSMAACSMASRPNASVVTDERPAPSASMSQTLPRRIKTVPTTTAVTGGREEIYGSLLRIKKSVTGKDTLINKQASINTLITKQTSIDASRDRVSYMKQNLVAASETIITVNKPATELDLVDGALVANRASKAVYNPKTFVAQDKDVNAQNRAAGQSINTAAVKTTRSSGVVAQKVAPVDVTNKLSKFVQSPTSTVYSARVMQTMTSASVTGAKPLRSQAAAITSGAQAQKQTSAQMLKQSTAKGVVEVAASKEKRVSEEQGSRASTPMTTTTAMAAKTTTTIAAAPWKTKKSTEVVANVRGPGAIGDPGLPEGAGGPGATGNPNGVTGSLGVPGEHGSRASPPTASGVRQARSVPPVKPKPNKTRATDPSVTTGTECAPEKNVLHTENKEPLREDDNKFVGQSRKISLGTSCNSTGAVEFSKGVVKGAKNIIKPEKVSDIHILAGCKLSVRTPVLEDPLSGGADDHPQTPHAVGLKKRLSLEKCTRLEFEQPDLDFIETHF